MDAHHLHGAQQRDGAGDVLVVGVQGLADADPRVLEAGQVHHAFAAVVAQCVGDQVGVEDRTLDERHLGGHELGVAAGQVVDDHRRDAGGQEGLHHV